LIRRGDLVIVSVPGDYGKPRPALVVQSDLFSALPSVTLCPLTSTLRDDAGLIRLTVEPTLANGLQQVSQVIIDKITTVAAGKVSPAIGHADDACMLRVNRALTVFLGIA
jgi:mRNA interferase MazF